MYKNSKSSTIETEISRPSNYNFYQASRYFQCLEYLQIILNCSKSCFTRVYKKNTHLFQYLYGGKFNTLYEMQLHIQNRTQLISVNSVLDIFGTI